MLTICQCPHLQIRDIEYASEVPMQSRHAGRAWSKIALRQRIIPALIEDRRGVTAIEYALIAALVAVAAIAAMQLVGTSLTGTFNSIATQL